MPGIKCERILCLLFKFDGCATGAFLHILCEYLKEKDM